MNQCKLIFINQSVEGMIILVSCPDCKSKYHIKDRFIMLRDKNKTFICKNCGSKYSLHVFPFNMAFIFTVIVFIIFNRKIFLWLNSFINNNFISDILKLLLGALWMYSFVFLTSFFIKHKKI